MRKVVGVIEAAVALAVAQLLTRAIPFAWLVPLLGRTTGALGAGVPDGQTREPRAAAVGQSLERAAVRLPWNSSCLARAVAGRLMLAWRRVPAAVVVGVRTEAGALNAHAWLVCDGGFVCGGPDVGDYHPIAAFGAAEDS